MQSIEALVRAHLSLYPGMEMADCIKLVYQNELGGGHLIEDPTLFRTRVTEELNGPLLGAAPAGAEDIGNGRRRVPLAYLTEGPAVETFTRLCARSAKLYPGSRAVCMEKLLALRRLAEEGKLPYAPQEAVAQVDAYMEKDLVPQHHSGRFKSLYNPHYRILDAASALFLPVFRAIDKALGQKPHVLVCIDGMAAAGKSMLAGMIADVYGNGTVHTDDFFLRPAQRTRERLAEAGGNIDYERLRPVAAQAGQRFPFAYAPFNCQTGDMGPEKQIPGGPLTVLEGVYALRPRVAAPCDVRVFLSVDAGLQYRRITQRSGPEMAGRFMYEWLPLENRYFAEYSVRESCDVAVDTTPLG